MSHIEQRITVACPLAQAKMRLGRFFREHGNKDADTAKLALRVEVDVPGRTKPLSLQRSVIATIVPHHEPADMVPRYRVAWAPEHPGPFPLFAGELVVEGRDDYDTFGLCLAGDYTPPLGLIGKGFDAALGNRVAGATAADLLHRIRDAIEFAFAGDEAAKPHFVAVPDSSAVRDASVDG